ncbi:hypothetical protein ACLB1T_16345 [Escherichia coli]
MGVGSAVGIVSGCLDDADWHGATAIALAAGLIITNWDVVGPYFQEALGNHWSLF